MPQWYLDEPPVYVGDIFYMQAFWDLHTTRNSGMGLAPIAWDKIVNYADVSRLDDDLIEPFIRIIRTMDTAYMIWQDDQKPNSDNLGNKTKDK